MIASSIFVPGYADRAEKTTPASEYGDFCATTADIDDHAA